QDLDDAPDLLVAADDRIELAFLRELREIAAVLLERLVGALGRLRRDALRAADGGQRLQDGVLRGAALLEDARRRRGAAALGRHGRQQVLGAEVIVLRAFAFRLRVVRDLAEPGREAGLRSAVRARVLADLGAHLRRDGRRLDVQLREDRRDDAALLLDE